MKQTQQISYLELARIYTRVGMNAFGGWSTTYVLLEKELSTQRKLLSAQQLETAVACGQALPGPAQVIIAAQTSYFLKGLRGTLLATFCYLLPSVLVTLLFSFVYFSYLSESSISDYTIGVQAAVGGIVIGNAYTIAKRTATTKKLWVTAVLAGALYYFTKLPTLAIIVGFGITGAIVGIFVQRRNHG